MSAPVTFQVGFTSPRCGARVGVVTTPHGSFETPAFMPVGTRASVKGLTPDMIARTGSPVILNNTYHLLLRPGPELVSRRGGVHRFMNWPGPILTDSGGFQAFSLTDATELDDDGVTFRSVVDGARVRLTPERAIEVQNQLGADIIMALDDCAPADRGEEREYARRIRQANERTARWIERCARAHSSRADRALFGIVQGGTLPDERRWSVERVCATDLPGYAIGGVAVGEPSEAIAGVVRFTAPLMPTDRPRYLMGVGYERDLTAAVIAGVDMFDCVLPTRNGRNANAFTPTGQIRLRNQRFAEDDLPIDPSCDCPTCRPDAHGWPSCDGRPFTRAYLRHLFMVGEMLGPTLVSLHNVRHFQRLMLDIRRTVREDAWSDFAGRWPVAAPGIPPELLRPSPGSTGVGE